MLELITAPVLELVAARTGQPVADILRQLVPPAKGVTADLALPCFLGAKALGMPPPKLAAELAAAINAAGCAQASSIGPFLNLLFAPEAVARAILPVLRADPTACLRSATGAGRRACIDFSSPNIAKHLAFHHIRSTMIGNSLARLYAAAGWQVTRINFLGDWGTAFGRLIAGWKREGLSMAQLEAAPNKVGFLNELYVRISRLEKTDPSVEEEARQWSRRCEQDDPEALALWETIRAVSIAACKEVYQVLGVEFDDWNGEAHYRHAVTPVVDELRAKGLLSIDQGAHVVDLTSFGMKKPCLILRSDGGSLYATRDLAACDDRYATYRFDRCIYEVDLGQSLHFKEWFSVARLLGRPYADNLRHVGHGLILIWNDDTSGWEKTATRNGVPMMLMDILREGIQRADAVVREKNPDLPQAEREAVARAVGVGAVVFNDLKNARSNDVKFKFEEALRFDGETGPYIQFSHARLCSIERKFAEAHPGCQAGDPARLVRDDEKSVLFAIARLRSQLDRAVDADEPSILAQSLLGLAAAVSSWLTAGNRDATAKVMCDDVTMSASRLLLVGAARGAIGEGLRLLGLSAPERM